MTSLPWMLCGGIFVLMGGYQYLAATFEFEAGMMLQGVDPEHVDREGRRAGVRRNRLVGAAFVVVGFLIVGYGLLA